MLSMVCILWSGDLWEGLTSVSQQQELLLLISFITETMYNLSSAKLLLLRRLSTLQPCTINYWHFLSKYEVVPCPRSCVQLQPLGIFALSNQIFFLGTFQFIYSNNSKGRVPPIFAQKMSIIWNTEGNWYLPKIQWMIKTSLTFLNKYEVVPCPRSCIFNCISI